MVLFVDTNILLDVLAKREPFYMHSAKVWKYCESVLAKGCISALSVANLTYVLRKELNASRVADTLRALSYIFSIEDLKRADLENAALLQWDDFEDAIQYVTAMRVSADYLVTRNPGDYKNKDISIKTPKELCKLLGER